LQKFSETCGKIDSSFGITIDQWECAHRACAVQTTEIQLQLTNNHSNNNCSGYFDSFCNVWNWLYLEEWL